MDDGAVARPELDHFSEAIFGPGNLDVEIRDRELAFGGNLGRRRHVDDVVRLAAPVGPAIGERRWLRHVGVVAFQRASVNPRGDRLNLDFAQAAIVAHRQRLLVVGAPRRHLTPDDLGFDRFGPRPHIFVGEERHWRDLARAVARRAFVVNDRRDVFGKSRGDGTGGLTGFQPGPKGNEGSHEYEGDTLHSSPCKRLGTNGWRTYPSAQKCLSLAYFGALSAQNVTAVVIDVML